MRTHLVFVEGIIGSGKSTTARRLTDEIVAGGTPAEFIPEAHALLRVGARLAHPFTPWVDVAPAAYLALCVDGWREFVAKSKDAETVSVADGLLFHGNLTDLFLMNGEQLFSEAADRILGELTSLSPCLVYLRPDDLSRSLQETCDARGEDWLRYQLDWKLASPYAVRHRLAGLSGLTQLYRSFREACERILGGMTIPKLVVKDDTGWDARERVIQSFVGLE